MECLVRLTFGVVFVFLRFRVRTHPRVLGRLPKIITGPQNKPANEALDTPRDPKHTCSGGEPPEKKKL